MSASELPDEPLPATRVFVYTLGVAIIIGWGLMFWLLWERW